MLKKTISIEHKFSNPMQVLINCILWGKAHQNTVVAKRVENSEMQLNIQELINGALGLAKSCLFFCQFVPVPNLLKMIFFPLGFGSDPL